MRIIKNSVRLTRYDLGRIEEAINFIDQHYQRQLNAEDLALEVGLSKKKLEAGILEKTGFVTHTYLLLIRVEKTKLLLAENLRQIKEIASLAGFKNPSHYSQVFKKFTSLTPEEYRSRHGG